ncbi:MAG: hypothetical protein U0L38_07460, partial [Bacteroidales bacterium]|nr:hypothetical protein [Bacteroidales bacterium]
MPFQDFENQKHILRVLITELLRRNNTYKRAFVVFFCFNPKNIYFSQWVVLVNQIFIHIFAELKS